MTPRHRTLIFAFGGVIAEALETADNGFGRAAGDTQLQASGGNQVGHRGEFGHIQRVFVAHIDHTGAKLNAAGFSGDRRQKRVRGGLLLVKMVHAEERTVQADLFGTYRQIDSLMQRVGGAVHARAGNFSPVPKGEEAELLAGAGRWLEVFEGGSCFVSVHCSLPSVCSVCCYHRMSNSRLCPLTLNPITLQVKYL